MAGRKRHSAGDIVRKLRRADELAAEGKTGEEVAAELGVAAAALYNWRRAYGGMDADAAKELKELREQNARLKRLLAEPELEKDALREVAKSLSATPQPNGQLPSTAEPAAGAEPASEPASATRCADSDGLVTISDGHRSDGAQVSVVFDGVMR